MLNVSRRLADCRVNTDQTHSPSLVLSYFSSLSFTHTHTHKVQLDRPTSKFTQNSAPIKSFYIFPGSFSKKCKFSNLAEDLFCLLNI